MLYLTLFFLLVALLFLWQSNRQSRSTGLPGGKVIYADIKRWKPLDKPLYAPELGLTGKPDYLVEQGHAIIPVEIKTSRSDKVPFDAHIYQLGAYCVLVEHTFGKRPPYGILHYTDGSQAGRTYAIQFTPALEAAVVNTVTEIKNSSRQKDIHRSHDAPARCQRCGFRSICAEALN